MARKRQSWVPELKPFLQRHSLGFLVYEAPGCGDAWDVPCQGHCPNLMLLDIRLISSARQAP